MKMKNQFLDCIAHRSTQKAIALLYKAGYRKPANPEELYLMLEDLVAKNNEKAVGELAKIHPDAKIIVAEYSKFKQKELTSGSTDKSNEELDFANCGGCMAGLAVVGADAKTNEPKVDKTAMYKYMIIGGTIILSVSILAVLVRAIKNK